MTNDDDYSFNQSDIIRPQDQFRVPPKKLEPKTDEVVSKIVGKKILQNDPRVMKLVIKWKRSKSDEVPDNFLNNPTFISELKKVVGEGF